MRDILVTEIIKGAAFNALAQQFDVAVEPKLWQEPNRLRTVIGEFKAVMVRNQTRVSAELIRAGASCAIARAGVGLDNIDTAAATEAGMVVIYAPEQNSLSVAELVLGLMLALARNLPAADHSTRGGAWQREQFAGSELYGKTLGVIGLGRIGFLTAMRARAFGMDVIAHDEYVSPDAFTVAEARARLMGLDQVLAEADFVSCHVPETPQTMRMFDYRRFCQMKPTAFFVNAARGGIVDEDGLIQALREKRLGGAALDVRAKEPPEPSTLSQMDNVILVPHIGAFTAEAQDRVVSAICADVAAVLLGGSARNYFNFPRPRREAKS